MTVIEMFHEVQEVYGTYTRDGSQRVILGPT